MITSSHTRLHNPPCPSVTRRGVAPTHQGVGFLTMLGFEGGSPYMIVGRGLDLPTQNSEEPKICCRERESRGIISSFIEPFEYSFFRFEDIAFWAAPGIREILECNPGEDTTFFIPFFWIIDVMAFKTYPPG